MSEEVTVTIKKGDFKLVVPRNQLLDVSETHDGVVFNFKGGLQLHQIDQYMQQSTKQIIANTANSYTGNRLIFDLNNKRQPVLVDAT